jgi:hypothetical protein
MSQFPSPSSDISWDFHVPASDDGISTRRSESIYSEKSDKPTNNWSFLSSEKQNQQFSQRFWLQYNR